ncbi:cytochrome P450 [Amylostereum chailletii]|nr:cytochrome P450 [Amylostereum chailletii]
MVSSQVIVNYGERYRCSSSYSTPISDSHLIHLRSFCPCRNLPQQVGEFFTHRFDTWRILHNPESYPDPESFKPERFLKDDGTLNTDDVSAAFGFGRRICVGMHLARSTVWLAIAYTLATFNIDKAKDERGDEIPVEVNYSDGVVIHPGPFKCSVTLRDKQAASLVCEPGVAT